MGLILSTIILSNPAGAKAVDIATTAPTQSTAVAASEAEIVPYADVIVKKIREYNGRLQYRRWNETQGYWVDPAWIDLT